MNPFVNTEAVYFETTNCCPNARFHKKCPASQVRDPITLPISIVKDSLTSLASYGWKGEIAWHCYSEPLSDPRLFYFLGLTREIGQGAWHIRILTSGWNLDVQMVSELREAGVNKIEVTAYSNDAVDRLEGLVDRISLCTTLDDRILGYKGINRTIRRAMIKLRKTPCPVAAPLAKLHIRSTGVLGLCCFDWQQTVTFGDLRKHSLAELAAAPATQETFHTLRQGKRIPEICRRCPYT